MLVFVLCCRRRNGLPHQCAHWFAMTGLVGVRAPVHGCNARRFCQGCGLPHHLSALVRNDIHKPGRLAHLQSRVKCTTFLPKCVLAMTCKNLPPVRTVPGRCRNSRTSNQISRLEYTVILTPLSRTSISSGILENLTVKNMSPDAPAILDTCKR